MSVNTSPLWCLRLAGALAILFAISMQPVAAQGHWSTNSGFLGRRTTISRFRKCRNERPCVEFNWDGTEFSFEGEDVEEQPFRFTVRAGGQIFVHSCVVTNKEGTLTCYWKKPTDIKFTHVYELAPRK
jgi:hypothetical protein